MIAYLFCATVRKVLEFQQSPGVKFPLLLHHQPRDGVALYVSRSSGRFGLLIGDGGGVRVAEHVADQLIVPHVGRYGHVVRPALPGSGDYATGGRGRRRCCNVGDGAAMTVGHRWHRAGGGDEGRHHGRRGTPRGRGGRGGSGRHHLHDRST